MSFFFVASVLGWLALASGEGWASLPGVLTIVGGTAVGAWSYRRDTPAFRPFPLLRLTALFLRESVVSGVDVAWRAFSPGLKIDPGLMSYETDLEREGSRVLFANMLSLLPGTLCCKLDGRTLTIHALNVDPPVEISLKRLESRIRDAFET